jgi:hypothetical protein
MHLERRPAATVARAVLAGAVILSFSIPARADNADIPRARDAYDRGVHARAVGDHATAAKAFADADALAPTMASLEAALEAAMRADDVVLGAEMLERSESRPERDAALVRSIEAAKKRFAGRTGTIRVECKDVTPCLLAVDGRAATASRPVLATVGPHRVVVERGSERFERLIEVRPGTVSVVGETEATPPTRIAPSPVRPSTEAASSGVSPIWFFVGLGATVVAGAATTFSALDATSQHDDFVAAGCSPSATGSKARDCDARADDGSSATLRTNLLLGLTGVLAVSTALVGTFVVRWSPSSNGGVASIGGRW